MGAPRHKVLTQLRSANTTTVQNGGQKRERFPRSSFVDTQIRRNYWFEVNVDFRSEVQNQDRLVNPDVSEGNGRNMHVWNPFAYAERRRTRTHKLEIFTRAVKLGICFS